MCRPFQPTKGAVVRRFERGLGVAVDAGGVKAELACAGRENLVSMRDLRRRTAPMSGGASWRSRMACVRQNRVVLAVVATVKPFAEMRASPTGQTASSNSRGEGGQKEGSAPGRARHIGRQTIAQGRPGFGCPVSPLCIACAICSARGSLRVPAGARPSLRPFLREGEESSITRAKHAARTRARVRRLPAK
ncbi:hypothetical protein GGD65_005099 [Bradyrhizobium sp. CIR18]|nr:hypothetical protein [Bradyrhizobium sp. CIR18]